MIDQKEFDAIIKEIKCADKLSNSEYEQGSTGIYDKIMRKYIDKFFTSKAGAPISWNFIKGITKSAYNIALGMNSWLIKNKLVPSTDVKDTLLNIDMDKFITSTDDLRKRYNLVKIIANNYPEHGDFVLEMTEQFSKKEQNNTDNLSQIFEICDKIANDTPKLNCNASETKRNALNNLCNNDPQQGLLFIADMVLKTYPSENDLKLVYGGIISMLNSSKMIRNLYKPLVKILKECAKSGFNNGDNKTKLETICRNIDAKDKTLEAGKILSNNGDNDISDAITKSKRKIKESISKASANTLNNGHNEEKCTSNGTNYKSNNVATRVSSALNR